MPGIKPPNWARLVLPALLVLAAAAMPAVPAAAKPECIKAQNGADVAAPFNAAAPCLNFMVIDNPEDPNFNQLLGINDTRREIVGYDGGGGGPPDQPNRGYLVVATDHFAPENPAGATQTQVFGIDNETIATTVGFFQDGQGNQFGFVNLKGVFTPVTNPNSGTINGVTINQLLGLSDFSSTGAFAHLAAGFYLDAAGNAQSQIYDITNKVFSAPFFPATTFPGLTQSMATGVNDNGLVCGLWIDNKGVTRGWTGTPSIPSSLTSWNPPNGFAGLSFAGLNNNGIVVGFVTDANGVNTGYVLNTATKQFYIKAAPGSSPNPSLFPAATPIKGTLFNGINNHNDIVGFFSDGKKVNGIYALFQSGVF